MFVAGKLYKLVNLEYFHFHSYNENIIFGEKMRTWPSLPMVLKSGDIVLFLKKIKLKEFFSNNKHVEDNDCYIFLFGNKYYSYSDNYTEEGILNFFEEV